MSLTRWSKKVFNGLSFMAGVVIVLGLYVFVRAQVAPGTVTNPTFDPPTDVELSATLNCQRVGPANPAVCPPGFILTGGGGGCFENDSDNPSIYPNFALGEFRAECDASSSERAFAICCQIN